MIRRSARGIRFRALPFSLAIALSLLVLAAPSLADTVVLKNGGKLEGTVVNEDSSWIELKTRFGTQRINRKDIKEIIAGKTVAQEFEDKKKKLKLDDLDGHVQLALWAKQNKLRREAKDLWEMVVTLEPNHALANRELGRVEYEGEWYTPADLEKKKEADYRAKGYVKYEGEWIPKSEAQARARAKADADAKESKAAKSSKSGGTSAKDFEGKAFVIEEDGEIAKEGRADLEDAIGASPITLTTEHFVFISLLDREKTEELAAQAEETIQWVFKFFENDPNIRPWAGKGRYYILDNLNNYEDFLTYVVPKYIEDERFLGFLRESQAAGNTMGLSARTDGAPFAGDFQRDNTPWENLIRAKVGTWCLENYCGRIPAWMRTGWAAFVEFQFTDASRVRSITNTTYGGRGDLADKATDSKHWPELLRDAVEHEEDTMFLEFKNRGINQLDYMDLSKSWSIITFLAESRNEAFIEFCRQLRKSQQDEAFPKAIGASFEEIDNAWREWIRNGGGTGE